MSGHIAGQPLECFVNQIILQKTPLLDNRGDHVLDESGNPRFICGFRIAGGIDQDNTKSPQGYPDKGVYVTHVHEGSPAEVAGLKVHDKILQVNGRDMTMATHKKAVDYISRKPVLEMFIHRPSDQNRGDQRRGNQDGNLNNLENQMNKMNVNHAGDGRGEDGGDKRPGDERFSSDDDKWRFQPQQQTQHRPQPQPRTSYGNNQIDRREYDRQFGIDYHMNPQQKYRGPLPDGPVGEVRGGGNFDYQQQYPNTPLKPPRMQQFMPAEQQQGIHGTGPDLQRHPQMLHDTRRLDNQSSAFDNQMNGGSFSSNYRQDDRQVRRAPGPQYAQLGYQTQRPRYDGENVSNDHQHLHLQQQMPFEYDQQRPGYPMERRSNNTNFTNQNKFY